MEIIGPSGIGKTTLKNELIEKFSCSEFQLLDQRLIALELITPKILSSILLKVEKLPVIKAQSIIFFIAEALSARLRNQVVRTEWSEEWSSYLKFSVESLYLGSDSGNGLAARNTLMLDSISESLYARHQHQNNAVALFDEGILQRGITLSQALRGKKSSRLEKYFEICPAPECAIFLNSDVSTVQKRLVKRVNYSKKHLDDTNFAINGTNVCYKVFKERKIPTMYVDLTGDKQIDPTRIMNFVNKS